MSRRLTVPNLPLSTFVVICCPGDGQASAERPPHPSRPSLFPISYSLFPVLSSHLKRPFFPPFRAKNTLFFTKFQRKSPAITRPFPLFRRPLVRHSAFFPKSPPAHRRNPQSPRPRQPALPNITPHWRTLELAMRHHSNASPDRPQKQAGAQERQDHAEGKKHHRIR